MGMWKNPSNLETVSDLELHDSKNLFLTNF